MEHWIKAFRLRTLPLALASIFMGAFLAAADDHFNWMIFSLCISTTIFLQVLSNLANDYGDSIHGADSKDRVGPKRAVQSGVISLKSMRNAVVAFAILSFVSGTFLLFIAFQNDWRAILAFLGLGILSILAAVGYTIGKKPYGYAGLGDLSVMIFFGLVGVLGSYYLFTKTFSAQYVFPAISCGLFAIAVLNINNIRDIDSDKLAGKFSIPVRIGRINAIRYHWFLLAAGIATAVIYTVFYFTSVWQLMFLLSIPFLMYNGKAVSSKPSSQLDPFLRQMALSTLLFVITFGCGVLLSKI
ncbi:MAG TPA: 1,4-dihydroxy-2-naphthoate polyprenyltransferase [Chryseosolibacter sp.]|nr:1,4-dihydroxy-2-naphthoate polyprenyltransferase [Chryseosolibacter sp.]